MDLTRPPVPLLLSACWLFAASGSIVVAQDDWSGTVKDSALRRLAPPAGFINDSETWQKIWKAWRPKEVVPPVDFDQSFVVVGTVSGPNRVIMNPQVNEQGDVAFVVGGTRMAGPGFGYRLVQVSKQKVKSINGNPLEHGQSSVQDSVSVVVVGTLRGGIVAIGGETTGTTITANSITWELDLTSDPALQQAAQALDGKKATVRGRLERREGVEIPSRWIVAVDDLHGADSDSDSEVETPILRAVAQRKSTHMQIVHGQQATIIDIRCPFGIDSATIQRMAVDWPAKILVRLHLRGLESLQVTRENLTIQWSVQSTGDHATHVSLREDRKETALSQQSPYFEPLRMVGGEGKIPLQEGYFEVRLPRKLLENNPEQIRLRWIDFYRN